MAVYVSSERRVRGKHICYGRGGITDRHRSCRRSVLLVLDADRYAGRRACGVSGGQSAEANDDRLDTFSDSSAARIVVLRGYGYRSRLIACGNGNGWSAGIRVVVDGIRVVVQVVVVSRADFIAY